MSASSDAQGDASGKDSNAVAGSTSANGNHGKSALGSAAKNGQSSAANSGGNSSSRGGDYRVEIWLSLLLTGLLLIPAVIWAVIKSVRSQEESQDGEVVYKNLNVLQIYGRIVKKS